MRTNKVVWSEGLFLRPQLFQQQERYFEYYAHKRASTLSPFYWGFSQYEIDREALSYGKLVLRSARGVLPDGTPFDIPDHADLPEPLTILPEHLGKSIYLAVPLRLDNSDETIFSQHDASSLARFRAQEAELCDTNSIRQGPRPVQLAKLRLKLVSQAEMTESWIGLELTKVKAIQPDGSVLLHLDDYIPPVTGYAANPLL
ncbi:MAG: type VI secretion system baseplate subunit TssK, partial [Serratia inhibens]|uniref:type VI secretion system baseplate subunit TssK n=1 Tax=Serratia inhibens TaxID=2338073 RepID=UPI003C7D435D